jgi:hypothetical protein
MTTEWYRFFWNIYGFTGTGVVPVDKGGTGLDTIGDHQIIIGNANNVFEPASLSSASIVITYPAGFVNLELGTSTVTPGTYGSASQVGVFTVNAYGVLTAASNTLIGIDASQIISGTLPVVRGGTGATTLTGYVKGNGTSAFTASATVPTTDLSGTITNAQLANSTISGVALGGNLFSLTAGTGVSFSAGTTYNGSAAITITATGSGGTVTSVAATVPSFLSVTGSPITTSGTLAISYSGTALPTTNGGTNLTAFTSGGVMYASSTSALATGSALTFDGTNLSTTGAITAGGPAGVVLTGRYSSVYPSTGAGYFQLQTNNTDGINGGLNVYTNYAGTLRLSYQIYESSANNTQHIWYTSGSEKMRLHASGGFSLGNTTDPGATNLSVTGTGKFGTTVGVGAATPSASGAGISFPATQSASTDANTLDDYEEGTWTPTDASGGSLSITFNNATYTKIGRQVFIRCSTIVYPLTANASPSSIGGLPFTNAAGESALGALVSSNAFANRALVFSSSTTIAIFATASASASTNAQLSGAVIYGFCATYIV